MPLIITMLSALKHGGFCMILGNCLGLSPSPHLVWVVDFELIVEGLLNPNFILLAPEATSFWDREKLSTWENDKLEIHPLLGYHLSHEASE